ncbi:hypothetical protein, partial [Janthinobacterium sp. PSPC3-1]|uniref:hypothetical protein n=1 Tax=Janthinobacterium sp. PSPC3-1 TaxID=2804653 RepID=UPI003CFA514B
MIAQAQCDATNKTASQIGSRLTERASRIRSRTLFFGSSHFTGERILDFQKEVGCVPKSVS